MKYASFKDKNLFNMEIFVQEILVMFGNFSFIEIDRIKIPPFVHILGGFPKTALSNTESLLPIALFLSK